MAFPPLGNSDYLVASVFIKFRSNSKRDATFLCTAFNYPRADWDGRHDHLRNLPCEDISKIATFSTAEFCKWFQVGIAVYNSHQVKSHLSPRFSAACAAAIAL